MKYYEEIKLKDGRTLVLRNAGKEDSAIVIENFKTTHGETEFLLTYPEECNFTEEREANFLEKKKESDKEAEILAFVDNVLVGTAGIDGVGNNMKVRHRSEFGISILSQFWGLGIGRALTKASVDLARKAGYEVVELDVVKENQRAINLYLSLGFVQYGENKRAFKKKNGEYQSMVLMSLSLI